MIKNLPKFQTGSCGKGSIQTTDDLAKLKGALTTGFSDLANIPDLLAISNEVFRLNEKKKSFYIPHLR